MMLLFFFVNRQGLPVNECGYRNFQVYIVKVKIVELSNSTKLINTNLTNIQESIMTSFEKKMAVICGIAVVAMYVICLWHGSTLK